MVKRGKSEGSPKWMQLALDEARKGVGRTHPNPMVGCVVVKNDTLIAKGYHARAGTDHAEVVALKRAGDKARGADAYVTLEPCDHVGRTGPCTQALIDAGIKRVFVAMRDPHKIVYGRGFRTLRKAGIEVHVGLLNEECVALNEDYIHFLKTGRPFVVAKMAQSIDGRVATRSGESKWITSEKARKLGHKLRSQVDAILVGSGTVLADDPTLNCRLRGGSDPLRVILDTDAKISLKSKVVQITTSSPAGTLVVVGKEASAKKQNALRKKGVEVLCCKTKNGRIHLPSLLSELGKRNVFSILVEGGPTVLGSFFDERLVNKVHAFVAPMVIGGGDSLSSVGGIGSSKLMDAARLQSVTSVQVGDDFLITGYC